MRCPILPARVPYPQGLHALVEHLFQLRTVRHDPPGDRGVIDVNLTFLHELFRLAIAPGIRNVPPDTGEETILRDMHILETPCIVALPLCSMWSQRKSIAQVASKEHGDTIVKLPWTGERPHMRWHAPTCGRCAGQWFRPRPRYG
jgi:hypothetical protein